MQKTPLPAQTLHDKTALVRACLLGGAIGDALGANIEFDSLRKIREQFGSEGVVHMAAGAWPAGTITDDTQMTLFTAEALVQWRDGSESLEKMVDQQGVRLACAAYLRWLLTQTRESSRVLDAKSGLLRLDALYARRAPGLTCLGSLERMQGTATAAAAENDSKGCGGVMRTAPVGLFGAYAGWSVARTFKLAADFAALTHGHPSGYLSAGAYASIIFNLITGLPIRAAVEATLPELARFEGHEETTQALQQAIRAAERLPCSAETVETLGGGWVGEEALAIAVYCALAADNFPTGALLAVNHSGDSDSTGAITGGLLGLIYGEAGLPTRWVNQVELFGTLAKMSEYLWEATQYER